jgi:hypothetical protein
MNDSDRAALVEEAYLLIEQNLLLSNTGQRGQLRLVRRQIVVARKFKQDGRCGQIGFSNFLKQSIFLGNCGF